MTTNRRRADHRITVQIDAPRADIHVLDPGIVTRGLGRRWRMPIRRVTVLTMLYAAILLSWEAVRLTPAGSWWAFELLDIFAPWIYFPGLALLLGLPGICRATRLSVVLLLVLLGYQYIPRVLPAGAPVDGLPLRVMTANLLISNREYDRIAATITEQQPDIVVVQELRPIMAGHLQEALAAPYPYQILEPSNSAFGGLGILSRYPVHLEPLSEPVGRRPFWQRVTVDVGGRSAMLVHVHPPKPEVRFTRWGAVRIPSNFDVEATGRALQTAIQGADTAQYPVVVVGDFNVSDRQPLYRQLRRDFVDAYRSARGGFGFTFPNAPFRGIPQIPLVRIDYIMLDDDWAAISAQNGTMPGSDHRYLLADLVLR